MSQERDHFWAGVLIGAAAGMILGALGGWSVGDRAIGAVAELIGKIGSPDENVVHYEALVQ
jgi:uncharacterized membrane protein